MSISLITDYLRLHQVKQIQESVTEPANTAYYVFAAKHTPYANSDLVIDTPLNTIDQISVKSYKEMVFGKRVSSTDMKTMVPRYNWVSNTVYTEYSDNTDLSNTSFYVVTDAVSQYHVFKCLDNNGNTASTVQPVFSDTSADDEFYSTSDGYVWKYMYSVDRTTFEKFATDAYMPVVPNANVSANAVSGAIDVIKVTYGGSNYNTFLSNTFNSADLRLGGNTIVYGIADNASANNNFYNDSYIYIKSGTGVGQIKKITDYIVVGSTKRIVLESAFTTAPDVTSEYEITPGVTITGDGSGAFARALVNTASSNSIYQIEVVNRGASYTFASAVVTGNTGGVSNTATLQTVIGPKGGHGKDPEFELGGRYLGISVDFANNENNTIPTENDYRTIGVIKDPLFANVSCTMSSIEGTYTANELVIQTDTNAQGYVQLFSGTTLNLSNVSGTFTTGKRIVGQTSTASANLDSYLVSGITKTFSTFDQRHRYTATIDSGSFTQDETVYQTSIDTANATFHSSNSTHVTLTNIKGVINTGNTIIGANSGAVATLSLKQVPDLVEGSGEVLYIENGSVITRSNNQSEVVKLILKF